MTTSLKNKNIDLSIIIVNYNTGDYLLKCLQSIKKSTLGRYRIEVIIVDNKSTDDSFNLAQKIKSTPKINFIFKRLSKNLGFSKGNNQALKLSDSRSKYVLFLNPDTTLDPNTLSKMIKFFETHPQVDAATANLILVKTGKTQPESHRGFPSPWNAFCHFFAPFLPKLFPKSRLFNGYFLGHLDFSKIQKIDACVGAFLMIKREVGQTLGWWNEKYFFYGEDLDFCWQLKQHGFQLYFYPHAKAYHYQGISSGLIDHSQKITQAKIKTKITAAKASTEAMRIFYQENLIDRYPQFIQPLIWAGIDFLEKYRIYKAQKT